MSPPCLICYSMIGKPAWPCLVLACSSLGLLGQFTEVLPLSSMQGTRTQALAEAAPEVQMTPLLFVSPVRWPKLGTLPIPPLPSCKTKIATVSTPSGYYEG